VNLRGAPELEARRRDNKEEAIDDFEINDPLL
jgi:hypothetical protein